jgi:hypothetical protein
MQAVLGAIGALLKNHKLKMFSALAAALVSATLIFPYGDLSDYLSAKVLEYSNNSVFLDMDSISLSFFPSLGATLERVSIELPSLPTISVASLTVSPSIPSLLAFRLGGTARARGLFKGKGDLDVFYKAADRTKSGETVHVVEASLQGVGLSNLNELLRSSPLGGGGDPAMAMLGPILENLNLKGMASGNVRASFDLRVEQPPSATFDLAITGFSINLASLLGMEVGFEKTQINGRLGEGKILIERADLGTPKDEINAKVKGSVDLVITGGNQVRVMPGAYDLTVALNASDTAVRKLGFFLDSITSQGGKAEKTPTGMSYRFRALPGNGGLPRYLPAE